MKKSRITLALAIACGFGLATASPQPKAVNNIEIEKVAYNITGDHGVGLEAIRETGQGAMVEIHFVLNDEGGRPLGIYASASPGVHRFTTNEKRLDQLRHSLGLSTGTLMKSDYLASRFYGSGVVMLC